MRLSPDMTEQISTTKLPQPVSRTGGTSVAKGATPGSANVSVPAAPGGAGAAPTSGSAQEVSQAVADLNRALKDSNLSVEFSVDEAINRQVVKVIDQATGEVVIQVPNEAALKAAKSLDALRGLLFDSAV